MLAASLTGIAKIPFTAKNLAHLIAHRKVSFKQIFDCVASVCDTDFYVVAACHKENSCRVAHLITRLEVKVGQIVDSVASVCDTDFYVIAAGLFAQQAAQHRNSVASNHAVFFRPYYPQFAK